jgi:hypothetical protein
MEARNQELSFQLYLILQVNECYLSTVFTLLFSIVESWLNAKSRVDDRLGPCNLQTHFIQVSFPSSNLHRWNQHQSWQAATTPGIQVLGMRE